MNIFPYVPDISIDYKLFQIAPDFSIPAAVNRVVIHLKRKYLGINVYEAFQERMDFIFREFDNIYVSFSGGKDSGLLLNLVLDYMKAHGIRKKLGVFHQDFEAQYSVTTKYVESLSLIHI